MLPNIARGSDLSSQKILTTLAGLYVILSRDLEDSPSMLYLQSRESKDANDAS